MPYDVNPQVYTKQTLTGSTFTDETVSSSTWTKLSATTATFDPFVKYEGSVYGTENYSEGRYAAEDFWYIGRR